jgi:non-canonical (house-cleaning) NTP pyrophosphatase
VREALSAIASIDPHFATFTLHPRDVTDIAPRMPMDLGEIIDGARTRASSVLHPPPLALNPLRATARPRRSGLTAAKAGLGTAPDPRTFGVGLEGGLVQLPHGQWSLQSWAAVTDGSRWGDGAGPSLVLPDAVAARVVAGEELGDVIDQLASAPVRGTRGAWGVLTLDLIGRRDAFRAAAIAAFAPFYNQGAWIGS